MGIGRITPRRITLPFKKLAKRSSEYFEGSRSENPKEEESFPSPFKGNMDKEPTTNILNKTN